MKKIEELCISQYPWEAKGNTVCCKEWDSFHGMSFDFTVADCYRTSNALLIAAAPELYELSYRLVSELEKVIEHTPEGYTVIDCECSYVELAMVELRDALAKAGGEK